MTTTPAIEVTDLSVAYGETPALVDVDVTIPWGTVCGLVGINGSGKSTLLKAVMGVVRPDTGGIRIDGGTPARARRRGTVGYVPQAEDVDWAFPISVGDVVMMGRYGFLGPTRRPHRADREAVAHALDRVGLGDLADRQIGRLSGGQRKRAFVARALAQDARILLLDEPFAGVDTRTQQSLTALFRDLAAEGRSVVVSTHDLAGLADLCDEAVLLARRVIVHGSPAEVLRPDNLVRAFGVDVLDRDGARTEGEDPR